MVYAGRDKVTQCDSQLVKSQLESTDGLEKCGYKSYLKDDV
ncbi:hypothetical protein HanRHA438_Chr08g0345031 [Helianthus annuus]|nr:hypothetical protein HanRHA438_Chr08g0345031 [Helianthus annuus]